MRDKLVELIIVGFSKCTKPHEVCSQLDLEAFADYLIALGVTVLQWIPVNERLPEKEGLHPYLVTDNRGNYSFSLFEPGKRMWIATWRERCITHWMPLPKVPKEET